MQHLGALLLVVCVAASAPHTPPRPQATSSFVDGDPLDELDGGDDSGLLEDPLDETISARDEERAQRVQGLPAAASSSVPRGTTPRGPASKGPSIASQAAPSAASRGASVQWIITNRMKAQLGELGYTPEDISRLAPDRAAAIIDRKIRRPAQGVPAEWNRVHGKGVQPHALALNILGAIARVALTLTLSVPILYDPFIRGRSRKLDRRYDSIVRTLREALTSTGSPRRRPVYVDTTPRRRGY